jgi:hypothetical protein
MLGRAMTATRQVSLQKRSSRYVFRYAAGHEADVIDAFVSMASAGDSAFDWFDAGLLSYQIGRHFKTPYPEADKTRTVIPAPTAWGRALDRLHARSE